MLVTSLEKNINKNLSQFNINLISEITKYLNIELKYDLSSKIKNKRKKEYLILDILKNKKADIYLANDGSLNYADGSLFKKHDIIFRTHQYIHPLYKQFSTKEKINFVSHLSIIDALFNMGKKTEEIIKQNKIKFI